MVRPSSPSEAATRRRERPVPGRTPVFDARETVDASRVPRRVDALDVLGAKTTADEHAVVDHQFRVA